MSDVLVSCVDAGRTFGHGQLAVVAVRGVTCTVGPRSRVALMGPSGSGKSTLLHLMAGLDRPTSGSVGWPQWDEGPFGHPSRVGMVFQGPSLVPAMTALENVAFPLLLEGTSHEEAMARAEESLDLLGLTGLAGKVPDQLSGGQAQRVAVARVVASRPQLIVADEPTGRLDRAAGDRVVDVLLDAAEHLGAGLVLATHDELSARRVEQVWRMGEGELRP
ncbi:ABC transporter ATP-binding protein [Nocardioides sp. LS1]|uniref:ABC transporter ATP-binding protein n=1 Tax=Nocardioides sp. LS1 TaxID=1027620 RepID=UPI000F623155|nr:ATP-binding cassette domain-containing protein [Nocardioides sp. LS1]GCD91257.1 ABC transporter ATP-binding protein [Nocardioides sp. LS1]